MRGLYIHIPFCHQICFYCDFNKVFYDNQPVDDYISAVLVDLNSQLKEVPTHELETVFIGGGTPTALSVEQLTRLLTGIEQALNVAQLTEYTIEANPDELTIDKLKVLQQHGVNRLSIGVQSFNDELLKKIGRTHQASDVIRVIEDAKQVGFQNISIDLIYSLPEQTMEDWQRTLDIAFSLDLPHYSTYSLIIEPKTVFYNMKNNQQLKLPDASIEGEMFIESMKQMERHGRIQYEVSNFAKPGYESLHNLLYWQNEEYLGVGAGAHGYKNGVRYSNAGPLKHYLKAVQEQGHAIVSEHHVTEQEAMEEEMFLGLRKNEGVARQSFQDKFNRTLEEVYGEQLNELIESGLITRVDDYYRLTKAGLFRGNDVFEKFLF